MAKQSILVFIFMIFATAGVDAKYIRINADKDACAQGWLSMNVEVYADFDRFEFYPSCSFHFFQNFRTPDGTNCRIEAGMCSAFMPYRRIEVSCTGSFTEWVDVECP